MQISGQRAAFSKLGCGALALAVLAILQAAPALAASPKPVVGEPHPWEIGLQSAYSPVGTDIVWLNDWLVTPIIVFITALVGCLLVWVMWRYNAKRHPVPSRTTTNTPIEIAWTVIPALILVGMAIPSFHLVFYENKTDAPYMTLKVTGHQWYWEYDYPGQGNLDYMSNFIPQNELKPGQPRLLTVNHPLVLPVGKNIRILETSGDVIHSFFIPSLGVQRYAIPGQTIETWVRIDKPGTYYGECNQICGLGHHEMPIEVKAVPVKEFLAWTKLAAKENAAEGTIPPLSAVMAARGQPNQRIKVAEFNPAPGQASGKGE